MIKEYGRYHVLQIVRALMVRTYGMVISTYTAGMVIATDRYRE